ncbi:heparinase II/III domain-containing protein [Arthrobacter luteolus]|uniref:heparinase II/III domain-containing protein n=1 Tax=Arthrobacter luteolus TaxID=98672 RepID=UPI0009F9230B|nr:heparinase II/III family protein [Arthrobacter luteolus]
MLDISAVSEQLFHTYSTESTTDIPRSEHLAQLLDGKLTLAPHSAQLVGPDFAWESDPLQDANWRFQYHCLVWVDRLREASQLEDSELGRRLYERLITSWIDENPVESPASDYSWFDMAVGMRAIVLLRAIEYFGPERWLIDAIRVHGEHLADPGNYEGKGNHSLHQDMGLLAIGHFLEQPEWVSLSTDRILTMLNSAIDEEGVSVEGSIDYQYRNYRWYSEAAVRIKAATGEVPAAIANALREMPTFMAHATSPSNHYALIGDTLEHRAPIIDGTHTEWVRNSKYAPPSRVKLYKSGYLFARSSWDSWHHNPAVSYLTLRFGAGRSSAVHGHEDAGSITLDMHGEKLLCDSGLFAYEAGAYRLFFRGRSAHNVIDVRGRKYYPSSESPLRHFARTGTHIMATVLVRAIEGTVWNRTVLHSLERGYTIVDDRVEDKMNSPEVVQRWQLPAGSEITVNGAKEFVEVETPRGNAMRFSSLGHRVAYQVSEGIETEIAGWRSEGYRDKFPTPELRLLQPGGSVRFSTLIQAEGTVRSWISSSAVQRTSKALTLFLSGEDWCEQIRLASDGFSVRPTEP